MTIYGLCRLVKATAVVSRLGFLLNYLRGT